MISKQLQKQLQVPGYIVALVTATGPHSQEVRHCLGRMVQDDSYKRIFVTFLKFEYYTSIHVKKIIINVQFLPITTCCHTVFEMHHIIV